MAASCLCLLSPRAARADEEIYACGGAPNGVFVAPPANLLPLNSCPNGVLAIKNQDVPVPRGANAIWQATAPPGLFIRSVVITRMASLGVNSSGAYGGDFYWGGAASNVEPGETSASFPNIDAPDFGFNMVCGVQPCSTSDSGYIELSAIQMDIGESTPPSLSAGGLWQTTGWVRGVWPLTVAGVSPSGFCSLGASLAGQAVAGASVAPIQTGWQQCAISPLNDAVQTTGYPNGPATMVVNGQDAANIPVSYSETVHIDNQAPTVSLSGPTTAPATAGTQYVTATATAGPSGVAGISCSVDGAPAQWYATSVAQIPVSGLGPHTVQCKSANSSFDQAGQRAWSGPASYSMTIGEPTVAAVGFTRIANALRCGKTRERIEVPARWVIVRRHHRRVRVRRPQHSRLATVVQCHPRTVIKIVVVRVKTRRHGRSAYVERRERERIVLNPRTVAYGKHRIRHGKTMTVSGWLGTASGIALAGQPVEVLTAPDNGQDQFTPAASATTTADGGWSATLPPGPSRLIEAAYGGGATTLPSVSGPVRLFVRAKVQLLSVSPTRVPWGGTVHIVGRLDGGYLPPDGALVRLRIGEGNAQTTYGVRTHVTGSGRFSTSYIFGAGDPAAFRTFWFQIASLPSGDYPWSPAASRRVYVRVGGHPRAGAPTPHRRHRR